MDVRYVFIVIKLSKFRVWFCIVAELLSRQSGAAWKGFAPGFALPLIFLS